MGASASLKAIPSNKVPSISFSHVGLYVRDIAVMEAFYTRFLGFWANDRGKLGATDLVFLSRDPREHHQIVLASGRPADAGFNVLNQMSMRVDSLASLQSLHRALQAESQVSEISPVTHGNAISIYFRDPEGNRIELFIDTPWYVTQPLRIPIDLDRPESDVWAEVERIARGLPGFRPIAEWEADTARRVAGIA